MSSYIKYIDLPESYKPGSFYVIYNQKLKKLKKTIDIKLYFNIEKQTNTTFRVTPGSYHCFLKQFNIDIKRKDLNTLKSIHKKFRGVYRYKSADNSYNNKRVAFKIEKRGERYYFHMITPLKKVNLNKVQNYDKRLPLAPLNQKNYVFYFSPKIIQQITRADDKTNYNFMFNYLTDNPTINGTNNTDNKTVLLYNNFNNKPLNNFAELKTIDMENLNTVYNNKNSTGQIDLTKIGVLQKIPLKINDKVGYFSFVDDVANNKRSEINVILKLPNGTYDNKNNTYTISYTDVDNSVLKYTINLTDFNVILYHYKESKIGPMEFSPEGLYFYKTITFEDFGKNMKDLQDYKFTFSIKFNNYVMPVVMNSPSLPALIPLKSTFNKKFAKPIFFNISKVPKAIPNKLNKDLILNLLVFDKKNKKKLILPNKVFNVFLNYNYNNKEYSYNITNINTNEIKIMKTLSLPFSLVLKYLPSDLNSAKIIIRDSSSSLNVNAVATFSLILKNIKISDFRNKYYGKELLIESNNNKVDLNETKLEDNDYVLYYNFASNTTTNKLENILLSKVFFYNILFNPNVDGVSDDYGFSFENNAVTSYIETRSGIEPVFNYFIYYNKDLVVNDIYSAFENNTENFLMGEQRIKLLISNFATPAKINSSIDVNQELQKYETVGSDEFQETITSFLSGDTTYEAIVDPEDPASATIEKKDNEAAIGNLLEDLQKEGFFSENTALNVSFAEIVNIEEETNFVSAKTVDNVAIVGASELNLSAITSEDTDKKKKKKKSDIIATKAEVIKISKSLPNGKIVDLEITKTDKNKQVKFTNAMGIVKILIIGSLVVEIKPTHSLVNYNLDLNQLPAKKIPDNLQENAYEFFSTKPFVISAINKIYVDSDEATIEEKTVYFDIEKESDNYYYFILWDKLSNQLRIDTDYVFTIEQEGKIDKYFEVYFNVPGKKYILGENFKDEVLNIKFKPTLRLNTQLNNTITVYGNLTNTTDFIRKNYKLAKTFTDLTFDTNNIDEPNYIYTQLDFIVISNKRYNLDEIFDSEVFVKSENGFILSVQGLAYGGSGIVKITNLGSSSIPCITKDSYIKTPFGDKNITELEEGDLIITSNGETVPIIKKLEKTVNATFKMPYLIPKDYYGNNIPNRDTYISGNHAYKIKNNWKYPRHQDKLNKMKWSTVTYYNIKLPDYHKHNFICNNIIMESWNDNDPNIKPYKWIMRGTNIKKIFY